MFIYSQSTYKSRTFLQGNSADFLLETMILLLENYQGNVYGHIQPKQISTVIPLK